MNFACIICISLYSPDDDWNSQCVLLQPKPPSSAKQRLWFRAPLIGSNSIMTFYMAFDTRLLDDISGSNLVRTSARLEMARSISASRLLI